MIPRIWWLYLTLKAKPLEMTCIANIKQTVPPNQDDLRTQIAPIHRIIKAMVVPTSDIEGD